jgi:hypothetical protein
MSRQDTAILAVRLGAMYAWFQALEYVALGAVTVVLFRPKEWQSPPVAIVVSLLPIVALTGTGFVLWLKAPAISRHFLGEPGEQVTNTHPSAAALAFAVVGLAIFLNALPRVVSECIELVQNDRFLHGTGMATPEFMRRFPALGGNALQLALGFMLFVRPHKLARWWERKRDTNLSDSTNAPHN